MSDRLLLIDTDMLVLLGGSGTLADVLSSFDFEPEQCRRLAAATEQLRRGRVFKDTYPATVLRAVLRAADGIVSLTEPPANPTALDALASISGIDLGEAQLFAMLAEHDGYYLTTGDKRALVTLATSTKVAEIRGRVAGRVICLESILKLLVRRNGANATAQAFRDLRTHRTVGVLLSDTQARSDQVCLHGIDSYLNDLIQRTGEDFLYQP
ncbi:MAG: hypothetical protein HOP29_14220 [Phycisphaerales bacterium]|nr:hypothetical protein [Phycisphaerales bacterium]